MNKFIKILSFTFILCLSCYLFSGCTFKTYSFIGVVDQKTNEIILYADLDEETKKAVDETIGSNATIKLKGNDEFMLKYYEYSGSMRITYEQSGLYELDKENKTIIFNFPKADGSGVTTLNQQYEDGKIIYFANGEYLVFA